MSVFNGYVGAHSCTGGPQPGAIALRDWSAEVYHARNDGIYNCRPVLGSTRTTSLHGEGRAVDIGCDAGDPWAKVLAEILRTHSRELGIQCIIYDGRIWSGAYPNAGWRHYSGVDHHTTHLHVELSWAASKGSQALTVAKIRRAIGGGKPASSKPVSAVHTKVNRYRALLELPPVASDKPWGPVTDERAVRMRTAARRYAAPHGKAVVQPLREDKVQQILDVHADNIWGPVSDRALERWVIQVQKLLKVPADGAWGPKTDAAWLRFRKQCHGKAV